MTTYDFHFEKKRIRREILALRKAMTPTAVTDKSQAIIQKIIDSGIADDYHTYHCYFSINNEVDTISLMECLFRRGKTVIMPRTDFETGELHNYPVTSFDDLEDTRFGMKEPKQNCPVYTGVIDVVFVPGVAFDTSMHRLGYGKGFYDRFLRTTAALKVGLAYDFQVVKKIPNDLHDIAMDILILG